MPENVLASYVVRVRSMTATQVVTNISVVLTAVSQGEIIEVIGEDGDPVARLMPARPERMADVFGNYPVDPAFATQVETTVRELRAAQEPDHDRERATAPRLPF